MNKPSDLHFKSATKLAAMLRKREVSSSELLEHFLARMDRHNPALNAIIVTDTGRARQAARKADKRLADKDREWKLAKSRLMREKH